MSDPSRRGDTSADLHTQHRPKLRSQILFVFGILLLTGGAFYTALVVATQIDQIFSPGTQIRPPAIVRNLNLPWIDKGDGLASEIRGGRINVLVMGLDRRPSDGSAPARTDTMFVVTIDPSTKTARGLAFPRDLYVDIPTKTGNTTFKDRINAAYVYGETQKYDGGGAKLAETVVERLTGLKIHYYVMIDFEGFRQVINLLGGIDVDVPAPGVDDPFYSETEALRDYYPCVFKPGLYHMDGSQALCYARVRRNSSDLDRILRQQRIILSVMDEAMKLNVLDTDIAGLWKRYKSAVVTDINDLQIPGFARLAKQIDLDQIAFVSLGAATTPVTLPDGAQVLVASKPGVDMLVDAFLGDQNIDKEDASVEVQNGTGQQGFASMAVEHLASVGIPRNSLVAVNAIAIGHTKTEIIDYTGKPHTAEKIASALNLPRERVRKGTEADASLRNSPADILVILGSDAKITNALAQP